MMRSLVESSRSQSSDRGPQEGMTTARDKLVLTKFDEGEDVEAYLTFERLMTVYCVEESGWAIKLAPQLLGQAQQAYTALSAEVASDYKELKKAILRRYDICEEIYRQRFRAARQESEAYIKLATRLQVLAR